MKIIDDNKWKEMVDSYYTENYQRIKGWCYKHSIRFNYGSYSEDILNDLYIWLINNERRDINISKHILFYLTNMHFKNSEVRQYDYKDKPIWGDSKTTEEYINFIFDSIEDTSDKEIEEKYMNEIRRENIKLDLERFYNSLNHLERAIYKLYYIQGYDTIEKLSKHLSITMSYSYKYIKLIKKRIEEWKEKK